MGSKQYSEVQLLDVLAEQHDLFDEMFAGGPALLNAAFAGAMDDARAMLKAIRTPLAAELWGSDLLGMLSHVGLEPAEVDDLFLQAIVPMAEQAATRESLALLRAVAAVGSPGLRSGATASADRVAARGVREQRWASEIGRPSVGDCWIYGDDFGFQESVTISFSYGRKRHAVAALIDHPLGGGVKDAYVTDDAGRALAAMRGLVREDGSTFVEMIDPAEARSRLERALAAPECPQLADQIEDVMRTRALLRARVAALPGRIGAAPRRPMPPARDARMHRIKVALRGSKPPIWRRLEVESDTPLSRLHEIIQNAFGWSDGHLHVFETDQGEFGLPDPELGHADERTVTLAQVAPAVGDRFGYTYDFGDNWDHVITVEHVGDADASATYPRCTTGRRACPPEDCGGIWGYEDLLTVIVDPDHDEHEDMTARLGMRGADFDPAAFDLAEVNSRLMADRSVRLRS